MKSINKSPTKDAVVHAYYTQHNYSIGLRMVVASLYNLLIALRMRLLKVGYR